MSEEQASLSSPCVQPRWPASAADVFLRPLRALDPIDHTHSRPELPDSRLPGDPSAGRSGAPSMQIAYLRSWRGRACARPIVKRLISFPPFLQSCSPQGGPSPSLMYKTTTRVGKVALMCNALPTLCGQSGYRNADLNNNTAEVGTPSCVLIPLPSR